MLGPRFIDSSTGAAAPEDSTMTTIQCECDRDVDTHVKVSATENRPFFTSMLRLRYALALCERQHAINTLQSMPEPELLNRAEREVWWMEFKTWHRIQRRLARYERVAERHNVSLL